MCQKDEILLYVTMGITWNIDISKYWYDITYAHKNILFHIMCLTISNYNFLVLALILDFLKYYLFQCHISTSLFGCIYHIFFHNIKEMIGYLK